jgi:hypothetical protein
MARALFRGGTLDGQRHPVPAHAPAVIRHRVDGAVAFYTWKAGTKRTYTFAGESGAEDRLIAELAEAFPGAREEPGTGGPGSADHLLTQRECELAERFRADYPWLAADGQGPR